MHLIEESEPVLQGDVTAVDGQLDARLVAINEHLPAPVQKDAYFFAVAVGDVLELFGVDAFAAFFAFDLLLPPPRIVFRSTPRLFRYNRLVSAIPLLKPPIFHLQLGVTSALSAA